MTRSDVISSLFPARGGASSQDPEDELLERAKQTTRVLRDLVPSATFALCAWNPLSGTHVHRDLASDGYSRDTLDYINDGYVRDNSAFRLLRSEVPRALLWRDLEHDYQLDFSRTLIAEEFLLPAGLREGTTACLWLPDGRYTGAFHANWSNPREATDERRETIERFRPLLAAVCDLLRLPRMLLLQSEHRVGAIVLSDEGRAVEVPSHRPAAVLSEGAPLRRYFESHPQQRRRRFVWPAGRDGCHRIDVVPCRDGTVLVTEQAIGWPYGLTPRELQILHLTAAGLSNPQIAERLVVSPRTVSTHMEHILAKLQCSSRAQLAAKAASEGLLLIEDPRTEPLFAPADRLGQDWDPA